MAAGLPWGQDPRIEMICHQRKIRDDHYRIEGCALQGYALKECTVKAISRKDAADVILRYEWLKSMPQIGRAYYGLFAPRENLIGAVCFGKGPSPQAANFCGEENTSHIACLERGACAPVARPENGHADNAASFLISRACKQARRDHGWGAFFAYSDVVAGEIGTVYQACNWLYLGQGAQRGPGRKEYFDPNGDRYTSRRMRSKLRREKYPKTLKQWFPEVGEPAGWQRGNTVNKHKYVLILDKRLKLDRERFSPIAYPKREDAKSAGAAIADWRVHHWPSYEDIRRKMLQKV